MWTLETLGPKRDVAVCRDRLTCALDKVARALASVQTDSMAAACMMISSARTVGVYGCGREGYQMRGFAMRLFHMGCDVGFVGDTTMPALGANSVLVVSSGPGGLATVQAHMATARSAGAKILLITAQPDIAEAAKADHVLYVPAQTMATDGVTDETDILPMGSVYEGALFFLLEWLVSDLKPLRNETAATMRVRHTNME